MRVLAAITDPVISQRILVCLGLPERAPPIATAPPSVRVGVDLALDWDFDQTPPEDWGTAG